MTLGAWNLRDDTEFYAVKRLMAAVLERAVLDYVDPPSSASRDDGSLMTGEEISDKAKWYIFGDTIPHTFSFSSACYVLDIDPDRLREGVEEKKRRGARNLFGEYRR